MSVTTKGLRDKRAQLAEEANQILKAAAEDKRELLRSDEEEKWQGIHSEIDKLTAHIEMREKQDDLEDRLSKSAGRKTDPGQPTEERVDGARAAIRRAARGQEDSLEGLRSWFLAGSDHPLTPEHLAVAQRVGIDLKQRSLTLRFGDRPMVGGWSGRGSAGPAEAWEYRTASGVGSGSIGGYSVPDEAMRALESALLQFGGMRAKSTVIRTGSGADLPIPMENDTGNVGAIVGENSAQSEGSLTFTQLVLNAFKYTSNYILVSVELLQDSSFDFGAFVGRKLGERIGRITNTHFTTGDGSSKPRGIVAAATAGKTGASGQTTTILYADLVDLEHSVDPAYRVNNPNAGWMMSDAMLKTLKKLVDGQSRPLWLPGMAVREPDTILGYPYIINQDVAVPAASAKSLLFGDLSKYIVRDVRDVTLMRLDERFAEYQQVAFLAFSRHDGDLMDAGTHPVKYYIHPAS